MMKTLELYDLSHSLAGEYLAQFEYPWQALAGIKNLILTLGKTLGEEYTEVSPEVWVHSTAKVAPTACIGAPCIIDHGAEVRHCAFIRGSAIVGKNAVVGDRKRRAGRTALFIFCSMDCLRRVLSVKPVS